MSDPTEAPSNGAPAPAPAPADAPADTVTRAQMEEAITRARDSAWAEARRTLTGKQRQSGKSETANDRMEKSETSDIGDRITRQNDALQDVLDERPLSKEARRALRDMMRTVNPEDPAAWARETVSRLYGEPSKPDTANTATTPAPVPATPPQSDRGAPQALPVWERPSNPFEWTTEDIARLEAQKGRREASRLIRQKAEEYARLIRMQVVGGQRPR